MRQEFLKHLASYRWVACPSPCHVDWHRARQSITESWTFSKTVQPTCTLGGLREWHLLRDFSTYLLLTYFSSLCQHMHIISLTHSCSCSCSPHVSTCLEWSALELILSYGIELCTTSNVFHMPMSVTNEHCVLRIPPNAPFTTCVAQMQLDCRQKGTLSCLGAFDNAVYEVFDSN